jgi:hypothetical protein
VGASTDAFPDNDIKNETTDEAKSFLSFKDRTMYKISISVMLAVAVVVIGGGLYWIATYSAKTEAFKLERINKGFGYGKGIIVDKISYKGHSINVKYQIEGKYYIYFGGWGKNPQNLQEGDSIKFRYALDAPELIVTELDNGY